MQHKSHYIVDNLMTDLQTAVKSIEWGLHLSGAGGGGKLLSQDVPDEL